MSVQWWPVTKTNDTLRATERLGVLPNQVRREARRYVVGERAPHYPMPAINYEVVFGCWKRGHKVVHRHVTLWEQTTRLIKIWSLWIE